MGGVLGDAGSENPGRRPRVPASTLNTVTFRPFLACSIFKIELLNTVKILRAHRCPHGKLQMFTQNKVDRMKNRCLRCFANWSEQRKPALITNLGRELDKFDELLLNSVL